MNAASTIGSARLLGTIKSCGIGNDQLRELMGTPMKEWLSRHGRTTVVLVNAAHQEIELQLKLTRISLVDNGSNDMFDISANVIDEDPDSENRWIDGSLLWEREGHDRGHIRCSS